VTIALGRTCVVPEVLLQICQLSATEALRLERAGVKPDCRRHNHLRGAVAEELVSTGRHRFVGPGRRAVTPSRASTDEGYDDTFGDGEDRVMVVAKSNQFLTVQWLHGGSKQNRE